MIIFKVINQKKKQANFYYFPLKISKLLYSSQPNKLMPCFFLKKKTSNCGFSSLTNNGVDFLLAEKFVNLLMIDGKKSKAYQILYKTMFLLEKSLLNLKTKQNKGHNEHKLVNKKMAAKNAFIQAIENIKPSLEIRKVRIARTVYQVPAIVSKKRQLNLAIRWILNSTKKRKKESNLPFSECLTLELLEAFKKQGNARQKRDELHKLAEVNRAYVRYRWW